MDGLGRFIRHPARRLGLSLALIAAACKPDSADPNAPQVACTGIVSVQVTSGTTPTFSWTPACKLFFVLVEPSNSGADLWSVISDSTNAIASPVVYGTTPSGAVQADAPTPLVAGQVYKVILFRWTGPGKQDGVLIGTANFTP